ncbi:MAG: hypothetical protein WC385_01050 [Candidatus Paceibacterota bacterium]|jgi:hypothetical protein
MLILNVLVGVLLVGLLVSLMWTDHVTSGGLSKRMEIVDIMMSLIVVAFSNWAFGFDGAKFISWALIVFAGVRLTQRFWYVGFLSGIRRRRVEKLRARWQKDAEYYAWHRGEIERENATMTECSCEGERHQESLRHNLWLIELEQKNEQRLLKKLSRVKP